MQKEYRRIAKSDLRIFILFAFAALAFSFNVQAKKVFKWIDEDGNTHYGDSVPAATATAEEIHLPSTPAVDPDVNTRAERTERMLDAFQQERKEKKESKEAAHDAQAQRAVECDKAKERLFKYENSAFLYTTDENGDRAILGDEEHAKAIAKARAEVEKWCE